MPTNEAAPVDESEQRAFDVAWQVFAAEHGRPSRAEHKAFNSGWLAMSRRSFSREKRLRAALEEIAREGLWIDGDRAAIQQVARAALSEQEAPR